MRVERVFFFLSLAAAGACGSPPNGDVLLSQATYGSDPEVAQGSDDATTFPLVLANGAYRTSGLFEEVTSSPFPSQAAAGSTITTWVSIFGAAQYLAISPEKSGSNAIVPRGTIVVREVHDASTAITKLTLMAKGPPGYDPDLGDWFFLEATPDGIVIDGDGGVPQDGPSPECHSCHVPRATDDYLFGVPLGSRAPNHP